MAYIIGNLEELAKVKALASSENKQIEISPRSHRHPYLTLHSHTPLFVGKTYLQSSTLTLHRLANTKANAVSQEVDKLVPIINSLTLDQASPMRSLTHFPDELLENIVEQLEDESLMQLSMTCRRFNFFALPTVLARANIDDGNITSLYLRDPPAHVVHALRLALFVQNLDSLGICFGGRTNTILPYARELCRLVSRLPSMKTFYMRFSHRVSPDALHPGWQVEVIRLLDLVVQKSCVFLYVDGGDGLSNALATGSQSRPTINPVGRVRRLLGHFRETMKSVIPPKLARLGGSRNHCHGLREFQARSFFLFHPPFIDWMISTLQTNSQTLTAVSFETHKTPASIWPDILSNVTLPFLSKFKLTGNLFIERRKLFGGYIMERRIVEFHDVLGFLARHPSIVDLDLYAITRPTNRCPPRGLLPALQNLRADPWLISSFLNRKQPFTFLTSLKVVSELYSDCRPFDYNTFDNALYLLPGGAPHVTALHISCYPEVGIAEWLDKHISQENSPLAALKGVTTLDLFQSWSMWRSDVRALIPQFLARFPQLQHLTYASPPPDVEKAKQTSFIREVMLACPGMKTVTIELGSPVNLDMLRN
jgi:hypothetical protein